jgi:predicted house-cleaning noncanonical NTP pyrophosphatase (MazG superfamily)
MIHYNKLIRDNMPQIMQQKGTKIVYHEAEADGEYWAALMRKFQEEITEFEQAPSVDQVADILDVLEAVIDFKKMDKKELQALRKDKQNTFGGFTKGWILEQSEEEVGERQYQGI